MKDPFLGQPRPDFAEFERVVRGKQKPKRVHLLELLVDETLMCELTETYLGSPWIPLSADTRDIHIQQRIRLYHRLGYDVFNLHAGSMKPPETLRVSAMGTHALPVGQRGRQWVDENRGLISTWEDFERFPWDQVKPDYEICEIAARHLPEGMKMTVMQTMYTHIHTAILGTEGLFYLLYDNPDLVGQVFSRWGQMVYDFYRNTVESGQRWEPSGTPTIWGTRRPRWSRHRCCASMCCPGSRNTRSWPTTTVRPFGYIAAVMSMRRELSRI